MASSLILDGGPSACVPIADAAHDMRNLLAVIIGVCEALADGAGAQQGELARVGILAAERASVLVADLQPPSRPSPSRQAAPQPDGQGRTVLVLEDDPDLLRLITAAFSRAGFRTYSARNGRLGVQLLRALQPDLMVTDIVMPEKEGIAAIIEAGTVSPRTGLIAMSGGGVYGRSAAFLQWAGELGADEVLPKPFAMSQLVTAAHVVLDRRATARGCVGARAN